MTCDECGASPLWRNLYGYYTAEREISRVCERVNALPPHAAQLKITAGHCERTIFERQWSFPEGQSHLTASTVQTTQCWLPQVLLRATLSSNYQILIKILIRSHEITLKLWFIAFIWRILEIPFFFDRQGFNNSELMQSMQWIMSVWTGEYIHRDSNSQSGQNKQPKRRNTCQQCVVMVVAGYRKIQTQSSVAALKKRKHSSKLQGVGALNQGCS